MHQFEPFRHVSLRSTSSQRVASGRLTEEPKASTRLAGVLREQRAIAQELSRLQERQRFLLEEALILSGLEQRPASDPALVVAWCVNEGLRMFRRKCRVTLLESL